MTKHGQGAQDWIIKISFQRIFSKSFWSLPNMVKEHRAESFKFLYKEYFQNLLGHDHRWSRSTELSWKSFSQDQKWLTRTSWVWIWSHLVNDLFRISAVKTKQSSRERSSCYTFLNQVLTFEPGVHVADKWRRVEHSFQCCKRCKVHIMRIVHSFPNALDMV